eukprot:16439480-Heterocapsa_arctica.AAC.1
MAEDGRTFLAEPHLIFIEPIGHTQHVADHVRYADDLLTVGLANSFEQVRWRLKYWKDMWVKYCEPGGLLSSESKQTGHRSVCWTQVQQGVLSSERNLAPS